MKPWEIAVKDNVEPEIRKKIRRILKPYHSVGRPQNCLFCSIDTTWTINDKPVCPKCAVEYGFLDKGWLPDPCEVCGRQGEWLDFVDRKKEPERWHQVWEDGWSRFIACMKEKHSSKKD